MGKKKKSKYNPPSPVVEDPCDWESLHKFIKECFSKLPETIEEIEEKNEESSDVDYGE